jgi:PRTRC genetic system protein A
MKSDIEASKDFAKNLEKAKDKNPVCKIKPRVTAQSKGTESPYKGVFPNLEEAALAGTVISIIPARDGLVYEMRRTPMGRFITPVVGCDMLSEVRAGFVPALPRIPSDLLVKIVTFFRSYMSDDFEREVLVNIYWDALNAEYVVDAPEQIVGKASVESHENIDFANDRYIHFMDVHSHNSMKAFFSAIDDKDEKATRLYTVIGNLHEYFPDIKTRLSNGGKFWNIDPGEVFELVARPFPVEWMSKVHFRAAHDNKAGTLIMGMEDDSV